MLPVRGAWVQSLVRELDPTCMPQLRSPCAAMKTRHNQIHFLKKRILFFNWSMVDLQYCYFQVYSKVIQLYIYFFPILFPYRLLQDIEYSSLCYTVNSCCLSNLYIWRCISVNPILLFYPSFPFPFGNHKFVFCV